MVKNWVEYWNREEAMSGDFWQAQADFFVRRIRRELDFDSSGSLLDIGCGRGHVAAALAPLLRETHGADTSALGIEEARKVYADVPNLFFHHLDPAAYLEVDRLPVRGLNFIFCISVVQYYKNIGEVQKLIGNAKKIVAPGGVLLLADLLIDYKLCLDIAGVLLGGLESGTFFAKLAEVFSGKHNLYARIRSENPVLTLRRGELEAVCAAENTRLRFIRQNLTGNRFRAHALIELLPGT
ncbi:MAG: methyltransferase domain-containing protein [Desulfovibrio sp.]|jgi:SAM-dependent methyltransferase|nr:methyltransferase domain-containing protein [Desulfovibrio sp.]